MLTSSAVRPFVFLVTSALAAQMTWLQATPNPLEGSQMTYDSVRARVVLVGPDGTTWERTSGRWHRMSLTQVPAGLTGFSLAYDAARARTVLHGSDAARTRTETWEWDGSAWTKRTASPPPARQNAAMSYDSARRRVMLCGGVAGSNAVRDAWEWDGTSWTSQPVPATFPGGAGSMAFDLIRARTVLVTFDTWEHDGTNWTRMGPSPNVYASAFVVVYDLLRRQCVIKADSSGGSSSIWSWNGSTWTFVAPAGLPETLMGCFDAALGIASFASADYHIFVIRTWNDWDGTRFTARELGGSTGLSTLPLVSAGGRCLCIAGPNLFSWDGAGWSAQPLPARPNGPASPGSYVPAHDPVRARTLWVGCPTSGGLQPLELWEWDGASWTLRQPAVQPGPRTGHVAAFDRARGRLVVFGGNDGKSTPTPFSDTWEWDGNAWTQLQPAHVPSLTAAAVWMGMAYDPTRGRCVLYLSKYPTAAETWEWDGSDWLQRTPATSPGLRFFSGFAADTARGRVVLFGGSASPINAPTNDLWEWDGSNWTKRSPSNLPVARPVGAFGFDERRGRFVTFGNGLDLLETWELAIACDEVGPGHPSQPVPLQCSGDPRLGQTFCTAFPSPRGVAALALSPRTVASPPPLVDLPLLCSKAYFHPDPLQLLVIPVGGTTASTCFAVPTNPALAFLGLTLQGFADTGCVLLTNGVAVRLQPLP